MANPQVSMGWGSFELPAQKTLFDYDGSGNPIYVGKYTEIATDSVNQIAVITKFTWSGGNVTQKKTLTGLWENRTSLSW